MNVVLMRFRKNRKSVSLDEFGEVEIKPGSDFQALKSHSGNVVDRIDLQTAINHLPSAVRKVFILHDIQGYRHREIAQFFGRSDGNSMSQLHRARIHLRKLLQSDSTNKN